MISIGMDVGRERDPAALAVLHSAGPRPGSHRPCWDALDVGNLPLGTSYTALAQRAVSLAREFADAGWPVVLTLDATGIGAAVHELAVAAAPELHIVAVTIVAGSTVRHTGPDTYSVGKHRLTEVVQVALQQRGLSLPDTPGVQELRGQLGRFIAKPRPGGYQRHEAAGAGHDDLVLALALALWTGDALHDQHAGVTP
ncbi:hypothetical protein BC739_006741 [Kutzneria viridogrisea]|uniref:Terminase large subunit gp17-like C-terminal domain-containing protein n=1 Tax=Kutzneria viridogrisea TaxID=47990 RepID=A0ABR6BRL9_9PSEU|nr:hypothetical protein [Kutzneria viridogrisea]